MRSRELERQKQHTPAQGDAVDRQVIRRKAYATMTLTERAMHEAEEAAMPTTPETDRPTRVRQAAKHSLATMVTLCAVEAVWLSLALVFLAIHFQWKVTLIMPMAVAAAFVIWIANGRSHCHHARHHHAHHGHRLHRRH